MRSHISINESECNGCGTCASVCIRGNIRIENGRAVETCSGTYECFDCGHCMSVCPKNAIVLKDYAEISGIYDYDQSERLIDPDTMNDFLIRRRSCRWFKDEPLTKEELMRIINVADSSPTAENSQNVAIVVIDEGMNDMMRHIRPILEAERSEFPRIDQFCRYVDNGMTDKYNPLIWEGKQMILVFSCQPADALLAMGRMEIMAYASGFGGFYSRWIQLAELLDHDKLMDFFPEIPREMNMNAVFVIGRPRIRFRRTVPRHHRTIVWK